MTEVLITLTLIIILMIMLLPTISAVREESRLIECQSNQQQIYNVFISKPSSLRIQLQPENLRHHFRNDLGETPEVYRCANAVANSFGFNPRLSRLSGEYDAQKIFSLDYTVVNVDVVGPKAPAEQFVPLVAPRHTGKCNVLFFDGHVESRDPMLPVIDALAIDPRYCWVHENHWRPFTDIHLQRIDGNCASQNPRVATAPPLVEKPPEVALLLPEVDDENDEDDEPERPEDIESLNAPPTLVYVINQNNFIPDNTNTTYRIKMGDIHIFDDGKGDNTITLSGTDEQDFEVDGLILYLKAGTRLNFRTKRAHRVTLDVVDHTIKDGHDLVCITHTLNLWQHQSILPPNR